MLNSFGTFMRLNLPGSVLAATVTLLVAITRAGPASQPMEPIHYPNAAKVAQTDRYFGTAVADPYRWLEDDRSAQTGAWVAAENAVTRQYLKRIPYRDRLKSRLSALYNYPRYSAPFHRGPYYFFYKNDGLQNQAVLYVQHGIDGAAEVLLDPNTFSTDGTSRLVTFEPSKDGTLAVYGVSTGGSDWEEFHVIDVPTKKPRSDVLKWVKVSGVGWRGDGFYYSRYDAPAAGQELLSENKNHKVYFHRVGTSQSQDALVYQDPDHPQRFNTADTTQDERFLILTVSDRGTGKDGNALFYRPADSDEPFKPLVPQITDDHFYVIDNVGDQFLVQTNHTAPNSRVVRIDPAAIDEAHWTSIVPEQPEPLDGTGTAGGKLFTIVLRDVVSHVQVRNLEGKLIGEVPLPTLGTADGFDGRRDDTEVFYTFTSFTAPPAIYRYDLATGQSTLFRAAQIPGFNPDNYVTQQVFVTSTGGTRVPMFLVHRKDLSMTGDNPTLLYGYGGFSISLSPAFNPLRLALLEQGFVYAQANLRGGGEYGEAWHQAGTKLNKQNVFDDFAAAARWLIDNHVTSSPHLAIQGGSNGGLLIGATLNQHPELFGAAVAQVGVMDMLRFQKFTIGWNWKPDFGSSDDNAEQFHALFAYSPLHNVKSDVPYPPVLITTADHDDRVVPGHSFKYAATLQAKAAGGPFLIRIDTNSGHHASNTAKTLEETADVDAFLFHALGVTPVTKHW